MSTPPGNPFPWTAVAAVATGTAAVVTAAMAYFTKRMAEATSRSVKVTECALELERKTLEQSRDALLPMLDLTVQRGSSTMTSQGAGPETLVKVAAANHGPGPALVREFTMRDEVDRYRLYNGSARYMVIPPGETRAVDLTPLLGSDGIPEGAAISSFSFWYDDVYGRHYRSRAVFQYAPLPQGQATRPITQHAFEFLREVSRPDFSYGDPAPYEYKNGNQNKHLHQHLAWTQEGGIVVPAINLPWAWFRLDGPKIIQRQWECGISETCNRRYRVVTWGFWLRGVANPQLVIEIEGHESFVLALLEKWYPTMGADPLDEKMRVCDYPLFNTSRDDLSLVLKRPTSDFAQRHGLNDRNGLNIACARLYAEAMRAVNRRFEKIEGPATGGTVDGV